MTDAESFTRYSPPIRITLEVDGNRFDVAAMGPDHVVLRSPQLLGSMHATLTVNVDGHEVIRRIMLPEGINPARKRQPIVVLETVTLAKAS